MPMFEFQCNKCDHVFEELVFDETKPPCPKCQAEKTEKILSCACVHGRKNSASSGGSGGSSCSGCSGGSCATCH